MNIALPATGLPLGKKVFIDSIKSSIFETKLLAMGIMPGKTLELIRKAPFGGAWYIKIDGQSLALREVEAQTILIR